MLQATHLIGFGAKRASAGGSAYTTWSTTDKSASITLSNGNLTATADGAASYRRGRAAIPFASGKWFWEVKTTVLGVSTWGIANGSWTIATDGYCGDDANAAGQFTSSTVFYYNASATGTPGFVTNDYLMLAFDTATGKIWAGKNGSWFNSGDPAAGTGEMATVGSGTWYPAYALRGGAAGIANFGASAFNGSVPSGFNAGVY